MADKLTPLIIDALTRAATEPAGAPLYASKSEAGLFPNVSAAKPAAKKCLDDGLLKLIDGNGKPNRELYATTDKGLNYLAEYASPKAVIDDFVRLLEERRGELRALVSEARRIADGIEGMMGVVNLLSSGGRKPSEPEPIQQEADAPRSPEHRDIPAELLTALRRWSAAASVARDCPLPDLYRALSVPPTVGEFHDALRQLLADGRVSLHPWTGPLYALPEPLFALLAGHEIAYYVHAR